MNQTHNPQNYSFVQPTANRVNLTFKPTTADSRLSPSPFKVQRRELPDVHTEQGRSPVRRHFSTISPLKEVSTNVPYRAYSSKIEGVTPVSNISERASNSVMVHPPPQPAIQQQPTETKKPENINSTGNVGTPTIESVRPAVAQSSLPPRSSNKIIEERKNAIDQIINNCTQLNFGYSSRHQSDNSENQRQNDSKLQQQKLQSLVKAVASPTKDQEQPGNDLKRVRTLEGKLTPRGNTIDHALNREVQLRRFTSRVVSLKDELAKQVGSIDRQRQQLLTSSQEQRDSITKSYQQLYSLLKQYESKDLNRVLYWQEECLRTLKSYHEEFVDACTRLELMNQDITPNISMIKTQIDEQQYKTFMADYRKQIDQISTRVASYHSTVAAARPSLNQKDISKLSYDIVSLIDYPQGFNKSALCFSFEGKCVTKKPFTGGSKILVEDYSEPQPQPPASQPLRSAEDSQPPFRALFHTTTDDKDPEIRASPTFKKL